MTTPWSQGDSDLRFDWGPRGAAELVAGGVRAVVVVDVLSFTTAVGVAVERGTRVRPHRWDRASAQALATQLDAVCAVGRSAAGPGEVSLSPASIVAAAGERWSGDGSLRPAVEDLWGAGAVVEAFARRRPVAVVSPEAEMARTASGAVRGDLLGQLLRCASGAELADKGFRGDVEVAAELDRSTVVPVLTDGWFAAAG